MAPEQQQKAAGNATFICDDPAHPAGTTISWGPGYPPVQPPQCHGKPMTRVAESVDPAAELEAVPEAAAPPADPAGQ